MVWKGLTGTAALAILACGSVALAADPQPPVANQSISSSDSYPMPQLLDDATTEPAAAPEAAAPSGPTTLTPLMYALDPTSFGKFLQNNKMNITGFVEGGYFYDLLNPRPARDANGGGPTQIFFPGQYSNQVLLDQADITFSKTVDTSKAWDVGFIIEGGYGTDDAFIHGHGVLDNRGPNNPQNQLDLIQADVSLVVPIGSGLTVTAGKFIGFISNEVINPTGNAFYTKSYNFDYVPATNTGITGSYTFAKAVNGADLTVTAGITRGWNQAARDNNGAIDFLGQAICQVTSKLKVVLNLEEGPEATKDNSNYWTTAEAITTLSVSDQLTLTGDFLYSDFPHGSVTNPGGAAQWYGAALYAGYKFNSMFTPNIRAEWFADQGGFNTGISTNYYEITAGVQIHPLPDDNIFQWLQIRPEIREDFANKRAFDAVGDGGIGKYAQTTAAVDVIMQF